MGQRVAGEELRAAEHSSIPKATTGIEGLDDILHGGLPRGRVSLVCGGPGCCKTLMATQFIATGITQHGEPGVFVCTEESPRELANNFSPFGWALPELVEQGRLAFVDVDPYLDESKSSGNYDLSGLFARIKAAVDRVGVGRIVLDSMDSLYSRFPGPTVLDREFRRLCQWLKDYGLTGLVTAGRGGEGLTEHRMEEYLSDCVLVLTRDVQGEVATRYVEVVKYRGSDHGTNRYPFYVASQGISVVPITEVGLDYPAPNECVSTGVDGLDEMLGLGGMFRGSVALVAGGAGTGKSSIGASFAKAACERGERSLYWAFEESPQQIIRNMNSIGIELASEVKDDRLRIESIRPAVEGLEGHLWRIRQVVLQQEPDIIVMDPVWDFELVGNHRTAKAMWVRLFDFLRSRGITALLTSLTPTGLKAYPVEPSVSSAVDTWIALEAVADAGTRQRAIHVVKSRGMAHCDEPRLLSFGENGVCVAPMPQ